MTSGEEKLLIPICAVRLLVMRFSHLKTLLIVCIVLGFVVSAGGALGFWTYGYEKNAWERCDAKKSPEGAVEVLEAQLERTEFTYAPLGIECTWAMADGSSLSMQFPEARLTTQLYGGPVLAAGAIVALIAVSNYRDRREASHGSSMATIR